MNKACNKCGEIKDYIHSREVVFPYESKNQSDRVFEYGLCEDCMLDIMKDFKIKPDTSNTFDGIVEATSQSQEYTENINNVFNMVN